MDGLDLKWERLVVPARLFQCVLKERFPYSLQVAVGHWGKYR